MTELRQRWVRREERDGEFQRKTSVVADGMCRTVMTLEVTTFGISLKGGGGGHFGIPGT